MSLSEPEELLSSGSFDPDLALFGGLLVCCLPAANPLLFVVVVFVVLDANFEVLVSVPVLFIVCCPCCFCPVMVRSNLSSCMLERL